ALDLADHPGVVPAHRPQPDETHPDRLALRQRRAILRAGHQAPAFSTAPIAVAMRPRSSGPSDGCTGRLSASAAARAVSGSSWAGAKRCSETSSWFGIG